jgi:hypothetical protein
MPRWWRIASSPIGATLGLACNAANDADWAALLPVLQRDLRGQVFFR